MLNPRRNVCFFFVSFSLSSNFSKNIFKRAKLIIHKRSQIYEDEQRIANANYRKEQFHHQKPIYPSNKMIDTDRFRKELKKRKSNSATHHAAVKYVSQHHHNLSESNFNESNSTFKN